MRAKIATTAAVMLVVSAFAAACDDSSAEREGEVLSERVSGDTSGDIQIPTITVPTIDVEIPSGAATAIAEVPTTVARAIERVTATAGDIGTPSPPPPASPTTQAPSAPSAITITFVEFDCDGYRFAVESQPEALLRVHWTSIAPDEPDPVSSRSVSDNEVSQSPGDHTFEQSKGGWAKPGSNRLTIRGESVSGETHEESRAIDC